MYYNLLKKGNELDFNLPHFPFIPFAKSTKKGLALTKRTRPFYLLPNCIIRDLPIPQFYLQQHSIHLNSYHLQLQNEPGHRHHLEST